MKRILPLIAIFLLLTALFIPCSADTPTGYIMLNGQKKPITDSTTSITIPAGETSAVIYLPLWADSTVPLQINSSANMQVNVTAYVVRSDGYKEQVQRTFNGYYVTISFPLGNYNRNYQYITYDINISVRLASTTPDSAVGTWSIINPIGNSTMFSNGYGSFGVTGTLISDIGTYSINALRWSKTSAGFNLVADDSQESGYDYEIASNDSVEYNPVLVIDSVTSGNATQLFQFLTANATYSNQSTSTSLTIVTPPYSTTSGLLINSWVDRISDYIDNLIPEGSTDLSGFVTNTINGFINVPLGSWTVNGTTVTFTLGTALGLVLVLGITFAVLAYFAGG